MNADDLTLIDMLNSMSDAEWADFASDNRTKLELALIHGHHSALALDWDAELAEYQQAIRDGEADARQDERDFRRSKGGL